MKSKSLYKIYLSIFILLLGLVVAVFTTRRDPFALVLKASQGEGFKSSVLRQYMKLDKLNWNDIDPSSGSTPLMLVISNCLEWTRPCEETAAILLSQGAQVNNVSIDRLGLTALHLAVMNNNRGAVEFLLKNGANRQQAIAGQTSLKGMNALQLAKSREKTSQDIINLLE
jgi:Ankyrin repeats (many copies)